MRLGLIQDRFPVTWIISCNKFFACWILFCYVIWHFSCFYSMLKTKTLHWISLSLKKKSLFTIMCLDLIGDLIYNTYRTELSFSLNHTTNSKPNLNHLVEEVQGISFPILNIHYILQIQFKVNQKNK